MIAVAFSDEAEADLEDIADYIASDNPAPCWNLRSRVAKRMRADRKCATRIDACAWI